VIDPIYTEYILPKHVNQFRWYSLSSLVFWVSSLYAIQEVPEDDKTPWESHFGWTVRLYMGGNIKFNDEFNDDFQDYRRQITPVLDILVIGLTLKFVYWEYLQYRFAGTLESDDIASDDAGDKKTTTQNVRSWTTCKFWFSMITWNSVDRMTLFLVFVTSLGHLGGMAAKLGVARKIFFTLKALAAILQMAKILSFPPQFIVILVLFLFFCSNAFLLLFASGAQQHEHGLPYERQGKEDVEGWLERMYGDDGDDWKSAYFKDGKLTKEGVEAYNEMDQFKDGEHDGEPYDGLHIEARGTFLSSFIALLDTFNMGIQGDFEFFNQKDFGRIQNISILTMLFYIIFTLLVNVIALNALIALLGDSFDKVMDSKDLKSRKVKAELIVEYLTVYSQGYTGDEDGRGWRHEVEKKTRWGFCLTPCDKERSVQQDGNDDPSAGRALVKTLTKEFKKEMARLLEHDNNGAEVTFGSMMTGLRREMNGQFDKQNERYIKSNVEVKFREVNDRIDGMEKTLAALKQSNESIMRVVTRLAESEGPGGRGSELADLA